MTNLGSDELQSTPLPVLLLLQELVHLRVLLCQAALEVRRKTLDSCFDVLVLLSHLVSGKEGKGWKDRKTKGEDGHGTLTAVGSSAASKPSRPSHPPSPCATLRGSSSFDPCVEGSQIFYENDE